MYNQCEILKFADSVKLSNFLFAHDNIKNNLPSSLYQSITLVNTKHSQISRNQDVNLVNVPFVRTVTSGINSIKSKSVKIWNEINKLFKVNDLINHKRRFCQSFL